MWSTSVIARGKAAMKGSETEQRLAVLLYDESFQVISSFELNQIASLTYHEGSLVGEQDMTEILFEHLQGILSKPIDYSPLSVHKALVVTKHILIFGAEKVIQMVRMVLGRHVDALQNYNTALLAQQQTGVSGIWTRIKGGEVDKGGPVRELATGLYRLLVDQQALMFERNTQADPNSLVPVGDRKKAAFVSDDARLRYLRKKMEHQKAMEIRSNLAKAEGGFGAGYMARDGKAVVGAAHGIEEMIKQAQKEQQKFRDEGGYQAPSVDVNELREYAKEYAQEYGGYGQDDQQKQQQNQMGGPDLLALDDHQGSSYDMSSSYGHTQQHQEVDLLDFGGMGGGGGMLGVSASNSSGITADLFGADPYTAPSPDVGQVANAADLLANLSLSNDTADGSVQITDYSNNNNNNNTNNNNPLETPSDPFSPPPPEPKKSIMSSNEDRFSALDALAGPSSNNSSSALVSNPMSGAFDGLGGDVKNMMGNSYGNSKISLGGSMTNYSMPGASDVFSGLGGLSDVSKPPSAPPPPPSMSIPPITNLGSIQVSNMGGPPLGGSYANNGDDDDDENGFVMGGTVGTGLEPLSAAPAAPPPPPPAF